MKWKAPFQSEVLIRWWRIFCPSAPRHSGSHGSSPFPTAAAHDAQMKQRYSWLPSMNIKTWTCCPGHSISRSGQCVRVCARVWEPVQLLPCLSSQPRLRARLKQRLKANQVTADGVRTGLCVSVSACVCLKEKKGQNRRPVWPCLCRCVLTLFPWCHSEVAGTCSRVGVGALGGGVRTCRPRRGGPVFQQRVCFHRPSCYADFFCEKSKKALSTRLTETSNDDCLSCNDNCRGHRQVGKGSLLNSHQYTEYCFYAKSIQLV